jgi:hypothetical protein
MYEIVVVERSSRSTAAMTDSTKGQRKNKDSKKDEGLGRDFLIIDRSLHPEGLHFERDLAEMGRWMG